MVLITRCVRLYYTDWIEFKVYLRNDTFGANWPPYPPLILYFLCILVYDIGPACRFCCTFLTTCTLITISKLTLQSCQKLRHQNIMIVVTSKIWIKIQKTEFWLVLKKGLCQSTRMMCTLPENGQQNLIYRQMGTARGICSRPCHIVTDV